VRQEALRGLHYLFLSGEEMSRGDFKAMLGMSDRGATDALGALVKRGLLKSDSRQGKVRFGLLSCRQRDCQYSEKNVSQNGLCRFISKRKQLLIDEQRGVMGLHARCACTLAIGCAISVRRTSIEVRRAVSESARSCQKPA